MLKSDSHTHICTQQVILYTWNELILRRFSVGRPLLEKLFQQIQKALLKRFSRRGLPTQGLPQNEFAPGTSIQN